jgi:hypothetical protein
VIASNDINEEMNQMEVPVFWPERRYPWGTAQAFNPDHSDLLHLRWVPAACFCMRYVQLLVYVLHLQWLLHSRWEWEVSVL